MVLIRSVIRTIKNDINGTIKDGLKRKSKEITYGGLMEGTFRRTKLGVS